MWIIILLNIFFLQVSADSGIDSSQGNSLSEESQELSSASEITSLESPESGIWFFDYLIIL